MLPSPPPPSSMPPPPNVLRWYLPTLINYFPNNIYFVLKHPLTTDIDKEICLVLNTLTSYVHEHQISYTYAIFIRHFYPRTS